jgi:hypothetical protein
VRQPNPTTTDAAIASCDLEPISWEYALVKDHDTGVLLAWLVTAAIVSPSGRHQSVLALARTNSDSNILAIISGGEFPT